MGLKLYNCKVRLHGDVRDECRKRDVTAGEIRVLQHIHGEDAVLEIIPTGAEALSAIPANAGGLRAEAEERDRLERLYGEAPVAKLFGKTQVDVNAEIEGVTQPGPAILRRKAAREAAEALVG